MAIPSFEDLLQQAKSVRKEQLRSEKRERRGTALAKGISDLAAAFLVPQTKPEFLTSALTKEGDIRELGSPIQVGGRSLLQNLVTKQKPTGLLPDETTFLTAPESRGFAQKKALESVKIKGRKSIQELKNEAKSESQGRKIFAANQELGKSASDYIYRVMGIDPSIEKILTYGEADRLMRARGIDTNEELRQLGLEVRIEGLFAPEKTKQKLRGKLKSLKSNKTTKIDREEFITRLISERGYNRQEAEQLADEHGVK